MVGSPSIDLSYLCRKKSVVLDTVVQDVALFGEWCIDSLLVLGLITDTLFWAASESPTLVINLFEDFNSMVKWIFEI